MRKIAFTLARVAGMAVSTGCGLDVICGTMDANGDGAISVQEYRDVMGVVGEEFEGLGTDAEVREAIELLGCTPA